MERKICRWDHSGDYDYTDNHTVRDWGWEFIKRNPLYIEHWKKNSERFQNHKKTREILLELFCVINLPILLLEKKGMDGYISVTGDKVLKKKMAICEKLGINLTNPQDYETFEIFGVNWTEWGLHMYQDPDAKKLTMSNKATLFDAFHYVSSAFDGTEKTAPLKKGWCEVRINLAHPILPQIENIKPLVEMHQKGYKRYIKSKNPEHEIIDAARHLTTKNKSLWKIYIRCLDAKKSGIPNKSISREDAARKIGIASGETLAKGWDEKQKQAKDMVASGYRALMF